MLAAVRGLPTTMKKIDLQKGKAHVKVGDKYIAHNDSDAYLDAAKEEGRLDTRIKEVDLEIALLDDVDKKALAKEKEALTEKRNIAAEKASALAKKIMTDQNIRRHIQNLRRHINRQQMRNIKR